MARPRLMLILPLLSLGCWFDDYLGEQHFKYLAAYPVRLVLKNSSSHTIQVTAMKISPQAGHSLSSEFIHVIILPPGGTNEQLRIDEPMYEAIRLGRFWLTVDCEGRPPWQVSGETLERYAVHDSRRWEVTVAGMTCEPRPDAGVDLVSPPARSSETRPNETHAHGPRPLPLSLFGRDRRAGGLVLCRHLPARRAQPGRLARRWGAPWW
jgi:hypothetical protein